MAVRDPVAPARPPFRVSHVVFDVDGTLLDWDAAYEVALETTAAHASELCGALVSPTQVRQERDLVFVEPVWRSRTTREVRDESLRRLLSAAGIEAPEAVAELGATYRRARDEAMRPFDDVEATLQALHGRGFTLITASNGNSALEAHAFFPYLYAVHHAERAGVSKPDPRFFTTVLQTAGGTPATAVSVGDSIANDIEPPRALGMPAVLIDRASRVTDPSMLRITSLTELPAMLERVTPA